MERRHRQAVPLSALRQQGRYGEDMTFLISMYLCLVTSSVCCETGFSRWLSSPLTLCTRVEYR